MLMSVVVVSFATLAGNVLAPLAVCDLCKRVFSVKRIYDKKPIIPLNSQMASDVCYRRVFLFAMVFL